MSAEAETRAYIEAQPEPKRSDLRQLDALIRACAPQLKPVMTGRVIGYGPYHYRYESGHEGDSARISLAATKAGISVYICACDEKGYLAEQAGKRLGKASVGKSCIRFKKVADLDLKALEELLRRAAGMKAPGEV